MMKAAMTLGYGSPDVLETRDVPTPEVRPNEVLIRVRATPVTAGDVRLRSADFPSFTALPGRLMFGVLRPRRAIQGTMFAGRVVAVGSSVSGYAVGDDVFGSAHDGAYAEYLVMSAAGPMAKLPPGLGYEQAAAVPYGAITALRFLRDIGSVQRGDKLLIVGAAGGVGSYAVQIAKQLGAEVTALCSERSFDLMRELGADHVVDYRKHAPEAAEQRYDVIFDTAGVTSFSGVKKILNRGGRYMNLTISVGLLCQLIFTSLFGDKRVRFGVALGDHADMEHLRKLLESGALRPIIGQRFAFERIADAHRAAEARCQDGAVIVTHATV